MWLFSNLLILRISTFPFSSSITQTASSSQNSEAPTRFQPQLYHRVELDPALARAEPARGKHCSQSRPKAEAILGSYERRFTEQNFFATVCTASQVIQKKVDIE